MLYKPVVYISLHCSFKEGIKKETQVPCLNGYIAQEQILRYTIIDIWVLNQDT